MSIQPSHKINTKTCSAFYIFGGLAERTSKSSCALLAWRPGWQGLVCLECLNYLRFFWPIQICSKPRYNPFGLCLQDKDDQTKLGVERKRRPPIFLLWSSHLPPAQRSLGWDPYHFVSFAGCFEWSLLLRLNARTWDCLAALPRSRQPGRQVYRIELKKG